ncbi:regulatory protein RecX [Nesterenkonia rhizosphaerae]|uniref:Regulatory protein RecX n=1 Tax=Nesterenkonia rhizosphaerae TaxID=1348272 RepID=A0ABP9FY59_9MICC
MSMQDDRGGQQQKLDALRETLAKLEAGELSSDLFDPAPQDSATQPQGSPADAEPQGITADTEPQGTVDAAPQGSTADAEPAGSGSAAPAAEPDLNKASSASREDQYAKARAVVLRKLTGSPKSRHQLAQALREREFSEETLTAVLDRMEEVHLVNDREFARMWVRTRHETKGLGSAALKRELRDKGISEADAGDALEQLSADDETAAARELIAAKLRGVVVPPAHSVEDRKERDKLTRRLVGMLARRGHSPGAAFSLVREELDARSR